MLASNRNKVLTRPTKVYPSVSAAVSERWLVLNLTQDVGNFPRCPTWRIRNQFQSLLYHSPAGDCLLLHNSSANKHLNIL